MRGAGWLLMAGASRRVHRRFRCRRLRRARDQNHDQAGQQDYADFRHGEGWFPTVSSATKLNAGIGQGRTPMRNLFVSQSAQMERVTGRPFFIVTASMSR